MPTVLHRIFVTILATVICFPLVADDESLAKREQLQQAAEKARADRDAASAHHITARQRLQTDETELIETRRTIKKAEQDLKTAEGRLDEHQSAAKKANEEKRKAEQAKQAEDEELTKAQSAVTPDLPDDEKKSADQAVAEAQEKVDKAVKTFAEAVQKATAANDTLQTTQTTIATAKTVIEQGQKQTDSLKTSIKEARLEVSAAEQSLATATETWVNHQRVWERTLHEAGEWVSFTDEIAPILHGRCLACHNTKTAKGRLNLESYAALLKGGESGAAVDPGDEEYSNLCLLIEDGSMPAEADPLTDEQIALMKRWVKLGAKLDAGVDPHLPLIRIMPKPEQPAAPESYRAAIPVTAVAFSPDGSTLATSGYHEVLLWSTADGSLVRRIGNVAERIYDLEFHPDGRQLAVAAGTPGQLGEVRILDADDGSLISDLTTVGDALFSATFSPDGKRLAAAGADRAIRIFDVETGQEQTVIEDHADWVMAIAWSADGTQLASASRDKTAKLFDAASGDALATFNGHGDVVYAAGFLPDGKQVATVGADDRIRVWETEKAEQKRDIKGFGNDVFQILVLPDGRSVTCSADRTARLHTLTDGKEVRKFAGHGEWIYALAAHPETKRLATGSYDGEVRLWNLDDGKTVLTFRAAPGLEQVSAETAKTK